MTTRTIVTSQPQVACDVCERTLLRGEQPDAFIAAGRRLVVCELCAPRATHEGWLREADGALGALPATRPRRGRNLLERLPVPGWVRQTGVPAQGARRSARAAAAGGRDTPRGPIEGDAEPGLAGAPFDADGLTPGEATGADMLAAAAPATYPEQAVVAFNASEFPRRVAGVARSLGPPEVSVRSAEHLESVVMVVVAWELCWYRYEVDLSEGIAHTRVLEQGTELSELPHDDRLANAEAGDDGQLMFAAGPA